MKILLSNSLLKAEVDEQDYFLLALWRYKWRVKYVEPKKRFYITTTKRHSETIYLHRFIMNNEADGNEVHHKDGDPLNNKRDNLEAIPKMTHYNKHRKK